MGITRREAAIKLIDLLPLSSAHAAFQTSGKDLRTNVSEKFFVGSYAFPEGGQLAFEVNVLFFFPNEEIRTDIC